jgi:outer membrane protein TolC
LLTSVEASRRSLDIALSEYRDGIDDYIRILNSQQFLVRRQDGPTVAQGDVARYLIALYKASGGGWQMRPGQQIVTEHIRKSMIERTDWEDWLAPEK